MPTQRLSRSKGGPIKAQRILVLFFVVLVALVGYSSAQEQPAEFLQVITIQVRPNAVDQYEDYVKKILEGAKKIGATQTVTEQKSF